MQTWALPTTTKQKHSGFTIVELLIVIVIIAILAAITVVAFNGVQQRARNSARLEAVVNIYKQLEIYTRQTQANFGSIPACIPTQANYDADGSGLPDCQINSNAWHEQANVDTNFTNAGLNFSYPDTPIKDGSNTLRGIAITYFASTSQGMNGVLRPFVLFFVLEGRNQDCGPNSVKHDGTKYADDPLSSIVPAKNYSSNSNQTTCALSLTHYTGI